MISEMKNIASECLKHPRRVSVWSDVEARYVCPESAAVLVANPVHQQARAAEVAVSAGGGSSINPAFKLVFLTAAIGTAFFTMLCVVLHLATDGAPPPLMEKLIQGMFDLVKVGFGAIVGLLGGKALDQPKSLIKSFPTGPSLFGGRLPAECREVSVEEHSPRLCPPLPAHGARAAPGDDPG